MCSHGQETVIVAFCSYPPHKPAAASCMLGAQRVRLARFCRAGACCSDRCRWRRLMIKDCSSEAMPTPSSLHPLHTGMAAALTCRPGRARQALADQSAALQASRGLSGGSPPRGEEHRDRRAAEERGPVGTTRPHRPSGQLPARLGRVPSDQPPAAGVPAGPRRSTRTLPEASPAPAPAPAPAPHAPQVRARRPARHSGVSACLVGSSATPQHW
jgi:hypothetical protein